MPPWLLRQLSALQRSPCHDVAKHNGPHTPRQIFLSSEVHWILELALALAALEAKVAQEGLILTEAQLIALERKREKREAFGEIETEHPGYLGAQDTYYVGNIKGVGRIYQQTFIDTYSKVAFAKLYDRKNALTAADMLNDKVMPFFEEQQIP